MKRIFWYSTIFSLLVSISLNAAEPPLGDPNQPYDQFSMEVITPHVAWARPSVTGPVRALVIAPCWQFRDTVELAQRMSLDVVPLMVSNNTSFHGAGESMSDMDESLDELAKLRLSEGYQYQIIVIGKVQWSAFPAWVREALLKRVVQGTGLVYVSPTGEDDALKAVFAQRQTPQETTLLEGVPVPIMPLKLEKKKSYPNVSGCGPFELRLSQYGQGRVAVVDYHDMNDPRGNVWIRNYWATPFQIGEGPWYDYYFAILTRALQWTARRELPVHLSPTSEQGIELDRTALTSTPLVFKVTTDPNFAGPCTFKWRLRNEKDQSVFEKQEEATLPIKGDYRVALPALPSGLYVLDLWTLTEGKVAGWGSSAFRVKSALFLKELKISGPQAGKADLLEGEVILWAALHPNNRLEVDARDRHGRLVARVLAKVQEMSGKFSFTIKEPIGCYFEVTAKILDTTGVVEEKTTTALIPDPKIDNFMWYQWGGPSDEIRTRYATEQMKRVAGLTGFYDSVLYDSSWNAVRPVALAGAKQGLKPLPYCTTHIIPPSYYDQNADGWTPKKDWPYHCYNDPIALAGQRSHLANIVKAYAGCDVVAYSINEEGGVTPGESCFCDFCLKGFREYARKKYGDLETANRVWGTDYKTWEEVRGGVLADALQAKRSERWLDQRLFMLESYNRWQKAGIEGARAVDPASRVGPHVVVDVERSFDIPAMAQHWGTFGHDVDYMDAVRRSFMKPTDVSENESGNLPMEENFHRYWPWHTLLQGMTQIFWYPEYQSIGLGGIAALFPDFRPFECFKQTGEEVREIQKSVGPLFIQGEMLLSPVAIHWSTLSYFIDIFHHPETRWLDSLRDTFHAVADSGFVYRYVGTPQIESGELKNVKVLLLPYCQALTVKESEAIRRFVQDGGLLFADFLPGIFDANGTRLPKSQLADLFGEAKELQVYHYGKGVAVLTGSTLKGYTGRRGTGDAGDRRGMLRMIAEYAGIRPWCRVEDAKGLDRGDTEITEFRNGDTIFLGLLRDPGIRAEIAGSGGAWTIQRGPTAGTDAGSAEALVKLPKAFHVYDVRRQDYLGFTDQFKTGLIKARAKVFAFLPCKLTNLSLSLSSATPKQGDFLKINAKVQPAVAKACGLGIRMTVTGPDGKEIEAYSRTLVMKSGSLTTNLALGLDEPLGTYTITAEEVISGLQKQVKYIVK